MKNNIFSKIEFMAIVYNDLMKKSDAVVCLEGDGYSRISQTVTIFKDGLAKNILISGGFIGLPPFTIPVNKMAKKIPKSIPKNKIIIEENSQNTYEQGKEIMKIIKNRKWKRIILVASNFHQPRAYLTFLKTMQDANLKIQIFNAPARSLSWFDKTSLGLSRLELLKEEFKKIDKYFRKGHLISIDEVIKYQKWKEKQK